MVPTKRSIVGSVIGMVVRIGSLHCYGSSNVVDIGDWPIILAPCGLASSVVGMGTRGPHTVEYFECGWWEALAGGVRRRRGEVEHVLEDGRARVGAAGGLSHPGDGRDGGY